MCVKKESWGLRSATSPCWRREGRSDELEGDVILYALSLVVTRDGGFSSSVDSLLSVSYLTSLGAD